MDPLQYPPTPRLQTDSGISSQVDDCQDAQFADGTLPQTSSLALGRGFQPQQRYEAVLDAIDGIVWEADIRRVQFIIVNAKTEMLLGYSVEQWQQPNFWIQHLHSPDRDAVLHLCQQSLADRQNYKIEYRMVGEDGRWVWFHESVTLVHDATGNPIRLVGVSINISDRKQAEAELHAAHGLLQTVLDHLPIAVFVKNGRPEHFGKITFWNKAAERLFGWTGKALGKTIHHYLPKQQADLLEQRDRESFQQQIAQETPEESIDSPTLGQRFLQTLRIPLFDPQQQPQYLLGICQDVTERLQAEETLRKRAEQEALITAISRDIRQSLDLNQVLNTTVDEVRRFLQTDRVLIFHFRSDWGGTVLVESVRSGWKSLSGKIFNDPCFVETFAELYRQGRTDAIADIEQEGTASCYQNTLRELQARAVLTVPILQQGNLWGLLIAHHCAEPRKWQPFEVDLLKQLSVQVGIAIEQSELFQQVQRLNADLERQVQIRTAELQLASEFEATLKRITDRVRDSLDEDQILQTAIRELAVAIGVTGCNAAIYDLENLTSKVSYEYTDSLMRLQGRVVNMNNFAEGYCQLLNGLYFQFCSLVPNPLRGYVAMFACPILDDQGVLGDLWLVSQKYRAFNEQDIRLVQQVANQCAIAIRQARLYQRSQAQVLELEKLNHLKDDFLSTVSHELRTPMSNIKLAAQMLEIKLRQKDLLTNASTGLSRYFHILKHECQREINLINDLLDLSRLETGETVLDSQPVDLVNWLTRLAQPFQERARSQRQTLIIDVPADLPPLMTDLSHLERIFSELLSNACKYTPAGEEIHVVAQLIESNTLLQVNIINTGVEILPNELVRIFDKFYRIPNNDPWKHGGTGLGLALVKKLVEALGGKIWASSTTGRTCFTVTLPSCAESCPIQPSPEP